MKKESEEYSNESLLLRFFSGKTSGSETEEIIEWINSSEECRRKAKEVYTIYYCSELKQIKKTVNVEASFESVKKKLQKKQVRLYRTNVLRLIQKIAAVIVLPLSILTGYLLIEKNDHGQISYVEVTAKRGMVAKTILPDSTVVWLNSGSTLKYPSAFASGERNVEIEGEAFFDVRKHKDQAFFVNKNKDLSISVLGTQFNVEAYADDERITTTLVEGSVKVTYKDHRGKSKDTYLAPSQKLVYDTYNKNTDKKNVSVAQYIAWKEGKIVFEDTNLKDALHILSKHFNVDFQVTDKRLYSNAFTGKFEGERLDEILTMIKISSNINYAYKQKDQFGEKRIIILY